MGEKIIIRRRKHVTINILSFLKKIFYYQLITDYEVGELGRKKFSFFLQCNNTKDIMRRSSNRTDLMRYSLGKMGSILFFNLKKKKGSLKRCTSYDGHFNRYIFQLLIEINQCSTTVRPPPPPKKNHGKPIVLTFYPSTTQKSKTY